MSWLLAFYGWLVFVAATNLLWMKRPRGAGKVDLEIMIPARDEAANLRRLLPTLLSSGVRVTVFDDESSDGTGEVARQLGAHVIQPSEPLPAGWTGKNRACDALARNATADWVLFLDADVEPAPDFVARMSGMIQALPSYTSAVTGFPRMLPGRGLEPLYLGWVPWSLLASNPFGLVSKTRRAHNGFTNGQITAWSLKALSEVMPFERLKGEILEDVKIGRLLANLGYRVEVLNLSDVLSVRMYAHLGDALRGMSKNAADIGGSAIGSLFFATTLLVIAWAWIWWGWPGLVLLMASKLLADRIVRYPVWTVPFVPITATLAALTVLYSLVLKRRGRRTWKGRTYA